MGHTFRDELFEPIPILAKLKFIVAAVVASISFEVQ